MTIKGFTISIGDQEAKNAKSKKDFTNKYVKELEWTKIDQAVLADKLGELYDLIIPPKTEQVKEN